MAVIVFMITSLWTSGTTYSQKGLAVSTDSGSNREKNENGEAGGMNSSNSLTTPDKRNWYSRG